LEDAGYEGNVLVDEDDDDDVAGVVVDVVVLVVDTETGGDNTFRRDAIVSF
jgi:hypothetical protein